LILALIRTDWISFVFSIRFESPMYKREGWEGDIRAVVGGVTGQSSTCLRVFSKRRRGVTGWCMPSAMPRASRLRCCYSRLQQGLLPWGRSCQLRGYTTGQRYFLLQENMLGTCVCLSLSLNFTRYDRISAGVKLLVLAERSRVPHPSHRKISTGYDTLNAAYIM
jgi:hypothetical protein